MALSKITNGGVAASGVPSGGIIQVQRTQFTGTNSIVISAGTDTVLTDLTVNITPTSTSSIIKLEAQVFGEHGLSTSAWNHIFFFYRDTTKLSHAAAGNRLVGVSMITQTFSSSDVNADTTPECGMYSFFDSPSSTSQITYKVGIRTRNGETFYLNRTEDDIDANYNERGISFISATEIAG